MISAYFYKNIGTAGGLVLAFLNPKLRGHNKKKKEKRFFLNNTEAYIEMIA